MEVEFRGRKKITKFDSLKPLLTLLESTLVTHGLDQRAADMVVLDIAERLVTAGYGWDKVLQYQAKVSSRGHLDSVDILSLDCFVASFVVDINVVDCRASTCSARS